MSHFFVVLGAFFTLVVVVFIASADKENPKKSIWRAFSILIFLCAVFSQYLIYNANRETKVELNSVNAKIDSLGIILQTMVNTKLSGNESKYSQEKEKEIAYEMLEKTDIPKNIGNSYFILEKYDKALIEYTKAIEVAPNDSEIYASLSAIYFLTNNPEKALEMANIAIDTDNNNPIAYLNKGAILNDAYGRNTEAIILFNKAIEFDSNIAMAYKNLGVAYNAKGNYYKAITYLDKAIEINPSYSDAYNSKGRSFYGLGNNEEAISLIEKAIDINKKNTLAHYNMGVALLAKSQLDEALISFDTAIGINTEYADAYYGKTVIYIKKGKIEEAKKNIEIALKFKPNNQKFIEAKNIVTKNE